jgi:hypothetical protein
MRLSILSLFLLASTAMGQVSYWFSQFQKQGNAQLAQQFFATNGPGITFSYNGSRWVISATGGGLSPNVVTNGGTPTFNGMYVDGTLTIINYTNIPTLQFNGKDAGGSQVFGLFSFDPTNQIFNFNYPLQFDAQYLTNAYSDLFTPSTNIPPGLLGFDVNGDWYWAKGLSVTQQVVMWSGTVSNQVAYTNAYIGGLLVASGPAAGPTHSPSWIWPNGGHILWPNGGYILLP